MNGNVNVERGEEEEAGTLYCTVQTVLYVLYCTVYSTVQCVYSTVQYVYSTVRIHNTVQYSKVRVHISYSTVCAQ